MTFKQHLIDINACEEARIWARDKTSKECWETCENYSWLFWWADKENIERKNFVKCACKIARLVVHLDNSDKTILAIEAAENWIVESSEINRIKCADAAGAAYAAAGAAYSAIAYSGAASVAYSAARSASSAAYAAYSAANNAARSAAGAAYSAAYAARSATTSSDILKIIREIIPQPWTEPETIQLSLGDGIVIKSKLGQ